ncbi:hypothetical protein RO3G_01214 [Rhizopus delemar RA 99-880]|uniref:C2H2-type domain-containing protein n=1 Tax=Rhizopus delemar (strain RA 99-880 / ATCC MYA-4621 / FGSC 9543 / NRRL 43880) TaxID=246409 RepID=I1BJY0_RHIO9|nr:hypothetical protein RO3G_01214 [Rhizopus delemar RA 99-880]|eukprot:EIE76510.1 hypothetical protein RO3G_01214 [Rhizopus delemar RA 99-880]
MNPIKLSLMDAPNVKNLLIQSHIPCFLGRRSDLTRHYRIHTNDRPFACHIIGCEKSFVQRSGLTIHLRTHSGERPHICDFKDCKKTFADTSSLARHRQKALLLPPLP